MRKWKRKKRRKIRSVPLPIKTIQITKLKCMCIDWFWRITTTFARPTDAYDRKNKLTLAEWSKVFAGYPCLLYQ